MNVGTGLRVATKVASPRGERPSGGTHRFFDSALAAWVVKVLPGEFYITERSDEVIATILGSCVAACIRDPRLGIGGMNHFMLAHSRTGKWGSDVNSTRFGNFAMEKLINELVKAGCSRDRFEIKLFGGGNVIDTKNAVGTDNAEFALKYLADEGLPCAAQDLGGPYPRRILYNPTTGKVTRRLLTGVDRDTAMREEAAYESEINSGNKSGNIQLFR
ncbi:MAG: chemoreceptor glutamine deamidase CheD [Hyphomicrobiales bacterium]|nr:chemoreceptor glutamine deamidase CheD [Hyphomicrobiales bacterium]